MSEQDEKGLDIPRKSVVLDGVWTDFYPCADVDPLLEAKDARIKELEARADGLQELLNEEAPVMFADYERDPG